MSLFLDIFSYLWCPREIIYWGIWLTNRATILESGAHKTRRAAPAAELGHPNTRVPPDALRLNQDPAGGHSLLVSTGSLSSTHLEPRAHPYPVVICSHGYFPQGNLIPWGVKRLGELTAIVVGMAAPRNSSKCILNKQFRIFAGHEEALEVIWVEDVSGLYRKTAMGVSGGKGTRRWARAEVKGTTQGSGWVTGWC